MVDEKYNGYTNYETWLLCLNIDNEQGIQEDVRKFVSKIDYKEDYEIGNLLKEYLEEWFFIEEHGIYKICDVWTTRDWHEINWSEVAQTRRIE